MYSACPHMGLRRRRGDRIDHISCYYYVIKSLRSTQPQRHRHCHRDSPPVTSSPSPLLSSLGFFLLSLYFLIFTMSPEDSHSYHFVFFPSGDTDKEANSLPKSRATGRVRFTFFAAAALAIASLCAVFLFAMWTDQQTSDFAMPSSIPVEVSLPVELTPAPEAEPLPLDPLDPLASLNGPPTMSLWGA